VGAYAAERGLQALFTLGDLCQHAAQAFGAARHFADMDSLLAAVLLQMGQYPSVVVKGSRFMQMERVVEAMCAHSEDPQYNKKTGVAHAA
jgi:UDP-N-acetylmuramoyl-tripeptide--D-alanyl-D-alanine ligase